MKKSYLLLLAISATVLYSCDKSETDPILVDNSKYYDQDEDCQQKTSRGTCCDVDGRILVVPNHTYTYTYETNNAITNIEWEVMSGSITIISGQNTPKVKLKFGADFTEGQIIAKGTGASAGCDSNLNISKL